MVLGHKFMSMVCKVIIHGLFFILISLQLASIAPISCSHIIHCAWQLGELPICGNLVLQVVVLIGIENLKISSMSSNIINLGLCNAIGIVSAKSNVIESYKFFGFEILYIPQIQNMQSKSFLVPPPNWLIN